MNTMMDRANFQDIGVQDRNKLDGIKMKGLILRGVYRVKRGGREGAMKMCHVRNENVDAEELFGRVVIPTLMYGVES